MQCRWGLLFLSLAVCLAQGCDDKINQNFEQQMKDRDAARAGDPYAELDQRRWTLSNYTRTEPVKQPAFIAGEAGNVRASYQSMLAKLDKDKDVAHSSATFITCRPVFDQVIEIGKNASLKGPDAVSAAEIVAQKLRQCRDQALAASGDAKAKATATLLRRFASVGVQLAGLQVMAAGEVGPGTRLVEEGDKLTNQDRPGFHLTAANFQSR